jgi:hypothetical protein
MRVYIFEFTSKNNSDVICVTIVMYYILISFNIGV